MFCIKIFFFGAGASRSWDFMEEAGDDFFLTGAGAQKNTGIWCRSWCQMARLRNTGRIFMNKLNTFRSVKCTDWNSDPNWIFFGFIGSGLLADWKFSRIPDSWLPYPVSGLIPYRILIKVSDASLILSVSMIVACRVAGAAWNRFFYVELEKK